MWQLWRFRATFKGACRHGNDERDCNVPTQSGEDAMPPGTVRVEEGQAEGNVPSPYGAGAQKDGSKGPECTQ